MSTKIIFVLAFIVAMAAGDSTTETLTKHDHETKEAAKAFWAQLTPKERDCLKEKWLKNAEELKPAFKNCRDKKSGMTCVKEIPQIKECFAN